MSKKPEVNVVIENGEEPLSFEVLQSEIIRLANVGKQIDKSKLTQRAILLLLKDITGVSMQNIKFVLNALPELESKFIKK